MVLYPIFSCDPIALAVAAPVAEDGALEWSITIEGPDGVSFGGYLTYEDATGVTQRHIDGTTRTRFSVIARSVIVSAGSTDVRSDIRVIVERGGEKTASSMQAWAFSRVTGH